jgi:hypothetical protein
MIPQQMLERLIVFLIIKGARKEGAGQLPPAPKELRGEEDEVCYWCS